MIPEIRLENGDSYAVKLNAWHTHILLQSEDNYEQVRLVLTKQEALELSQKLFNLAQEIGVTPNKFEPNLFTNKPQGIA